MPRQVDLEQLVSRKPLWVPESCNENINCVVQAAMQHSYDMSIA